MNFAIFAGQVLANPDLFGRVSPYHQSIELLRAAGIALSVEPSQAQERFLEKFSTALGENATVEWGKDRQLKLPIKDRRPVLISDKDGILELEFDYFPIRKYRFQYNGQKITLESSPSGIQSQWRLEFEDFNPPEGLGLIASDRLRDKSIVCILSQAALRKLHSENAQKDIDLPVQGFVLQSMGFSGTTLVMTRDEINEALRITREWEVSAQKARLLGIEVLNGNHSELLRQAEHLQAKVYDALRQERQVLSALREAKQAEKANRDVLSAEIDQILAIWRESYQSIEKPVWELGASDEERPTHTTVTVHISVEAIPYVTKPDKSTDRAMDLPLSDTFSHVLFKIGIPSIEVEVFENDDHVKNIAQFPKNGTHVWIYTKDEVRRAAGQKPPPLVRVTFTPGAWKAIAATAPGKLPTNLITLPPVNVEIAPGQSLLEVAFKHLLALLEIEIPDINNVAKYLVGLVIIEIGQNKVVPPTHQPTKGQNFSIQRRTGRHAA